MTTETLTLTAFLLARIAEDEERAHHARGALGSLAAEGLQIAGLPVYKPARVLAECEAKRRIVERHTVRDVPPSCSECGGYTATTDDARGIVHHGYAIPWPCPTLRDLAAVYADRSDWREEWRA